MRQVLVANILVTNDGQIRLLDVLESRRCSKAGARWRASSPRPVVARSL
jgi:hypothetical protein